MFIFLVVLFQTCYTYRFDTDLEKSLRIVGGRDALPNKYPYIVRIEIRLDFQVLGVLQQKLEPVCTASLLNPTRALTAAHCIDAIKMSTKILTHNKEKKGKVRAEGVVRHDPVGDVKFDEVLVSKILYYVQHPAYRNYGSDGVRNDVALLKVDPMHLPSYARISSLDYKSLSGYEAVVAGHGAVQVQYGPLVFLGPSSNFNVTLQLLKVIIIQCSEVFTGQVYPGLCLAHPCSKSSSLCQGVSGGPLMHSSGVIGVSSMAVSHDCNVIDPRLRSNQVGAVTAVSPYLNWIRRFLNEK